MSDAPPTAPPVTPPPPSSPHAIFEVTGQRFALPIGSVGEVVNEASVTRIPHGTRGILGLINLRGEILPAATLEPWFGETRSTAQVSPLFLVVRHANSTFAVRISRFEQVVQIPDAALVADPAPGQHTNIAPRVWIRAGETIRCLSVDALARALQYKKSSPAAA